MQLKKEYAILLIIIISLIIYLLLHNRDRTQYRLPDIPKVSRMDITKLEIGKLGSTIIFKKKGGSWYIDPKGYLADDAKVRKMLDVIDGLTLTDLVSESKNYVRYDLNNDKKIAVTVWSGNSLNLKFTIGKPAATYRHTYIMIEDNPNVYHAKVDFRDKFDQTVESLRDRIVMSFKQNEIREILIKKQNKDFFVSKEELFSTDIKEKDTDMVWYTQKKQKVDENKLNRLISSLSLMHCEQYINDREKEDFKAPVIYLFLKGKKEYSLSVFAKENKDSNNYPAVSSENHYPFLLSDYRVNDMENTVEEIMNLEVK